jgi:hypothetical protein
LYFSQYRCHSINHSCGNDERIQKEQGSQFESIFSSSVVEPTILSSKIKTVVEETTEKVQRKNSKNEKKKHYKKHRHSNS